MRAKLAAFLSAQGGRDIVIEPLFITHEVLATPAQAVSKTDT